MAAFDAVTRPISPGAVATWSDYRCGKRMIHGLS